MGDGCPIMPTKGARTAQSVSVDVEFRQREARKLFQAGKYDEAMNIHDSFSPMERGAQSIAERGRGRSTYERSEILIPLKKEDPRANDNSGNASVPRIQPR